MINKRQYDLEYIKIHYTLLEVFLVKADKNILNISYSLSNDIMSIQVVLLDRFVLSLDKLENLKDRFLDFEIEVTEVQITKEKFNESKGAW